MKIAVASDHAGIAERTRIIEYLRQVNIPYEDFGCTADTGRVDYPKQALAVAKAVAEGKADQGILICGTGIGMSIAANKIRGIRAAVCHNEYTTEMARQHNDANILCLGARVLTDRQMVRLVEIWLNTTHQGGRHAERVAQIQQIEQENL